jgi:cell division protein FtsB
MNLRVALWARLQSLGFFMFAVVVTLGVMLLFVPLFAQSHSMQRRIAQLDREIEKQNALEKQQKAEIEQLKTDPAYVERTAREKLNLARPNETIFRFEPVPGARR